MVLLRLPHAGGVDQIVLYSGLLALMGVGCAGTGAFSIVESGAVVDRYHKASSYSNGPASFPFSQTRADFYHCLDPEFFGADGPYAQLYGMNSAMFNLGLTVGPELAGELKQVIGYGNMNIVMAAICAGGAILSFLYIGGKPKLLQRSKLGT